MIHKNPRITKNKQGMRPLDQIIQSRPRNRSERDKLAVYRKRVDLLIETYFKEFGLDPDEILYLLTKSLRRLKIPLRELNYNLMRQGKPAADSFLARHSEDVLRNVRPPKFSKPQRSTATSREVYPDNCCQKCGTPLTVTCYSKQETDGRVPRKNKICVQCYKSLSLANQESYWRYVYANGGRNWGGKCGNVWR